MKYAEGTPYQFEDPHTMSPACRTDHHPQCTGEYHRTSTRKQTSRCTCTCHGTTPRPASAR